MPSSGQRCWDASPEETDPNTGYSPTFCRAHKSGMVSTTLENNPPVAITIKGPVTARKAKVLGVGSSGLEWAMQEAEKGWVQMPGKGESTRSRDHTTQEQELF